MIKITDNSTFGYWNGHYVEPKRKGDPPFSISPEREAELVERGIAEYVNNQESGGKAEKSARRGKISGKPEPENPILTESDSGTEAPRIDAAAAVV